MKKTLKIFLILVISFSLSGCGCSSKKEKTECSMESNQKEYKLETNYKIFSKNNIVTSLESKTIITSDNSEKLKTFEKNLSSQYNALKKIYGGYNYSIKVKDNKLVATISIDYSKYDMKKFVTNNIAMKEYVNEKNQLTLDGAKKYYESTGTKCK